MVRDCRGRFVYSNESIKKNLADIFTLVVRHHRVTTPKTNNNNNNNNNNNTTDDDIHHNNHNNEKEATKQPTFERNHIHNQHVRSCNGGPSSKQWLLFHDEPELGLFGLRRRGTRKGQQQQQHHQEEEDDDGGDGELDNVNVNNIPAVRSSATPYNVIVRRPTAVPAGTAGATKGISRSFRTQSEG
jgi:hypothetical protein